MRSPRLLTGLFAASLAVLVTASAVLASTVQPPPGGRDRCAGALKEMDPIELTLSIDDDAITPGGMVSLHGRIHAWADLHDVRVTLRPEGEVSLTGTTTLELGTIVSGGDVEFPIPVRFAAAGDAAVHATVTAAGEDPGRRFTRNEGLFTVYRNGRPHANMGGFIFVALEQIQQDLHAGRVQPDEAAAAIKQVTDTPVQIDEIPRGAFRARRDPIEPTADAPRLQVLQLSGLSATRSGTDGGGITESGSGNVTVQGNVSWLDENNNSHGCYGCQVEVWDDDTFFDEFITAATTLPDGNYSFVVNNDDGALQGDRDIYVKVRLGNAQVGVRPSGGGDIYSRDSPIHDETPDGSTVTENFTFNNAGTNSACGILTGASWVAVNAYFLNGNSFLAFLPVEWPGGSGSDYNGSRIRLGTGDRWDWDVLWHEYGHYVMDTFDFEDNPGGAHSSAGCDADARSSKDEGNRLAWGEGWPTFFGIAGQTVRGLGPFGYPRVGDTSYQDLEDGSLQYDLDVQQAFGGEDNERAVMSTFFDLWDANGDGRDAISVGYQTLFDRVNAADPHTLSAAWAALRAPLGNAQNLLYGGCAADHLVGPTLLTPANNALVTPAANRNFSWDRRVGCGTTAPGNNFDLKFFDANTKALLLTVAGLGSPSHMLNLVELNTLSPAHEVVWAVEGRSTASPATGPYLGENFAITVNRPPVADAGPDQLNVECASHTTTSVSLNGTGSSDPDGDALTYTWSASGVTFNNNHSATPTGLFPKGTTVVTLDVSDGFQTDTDQMTVRVVDTTAPVIACPAPINVECSQSGGTPASDPAIQAFLAGATATDVCDATVVITNNAPLFFPHGATPVKFTAKDDDLNASDCTANVNVIDTTPPVIAVTLDRTSLWPPNHKMAVIRATVVVTDICDPSPTFVLTSITSNEPDNGLGDGDTANDIQFASTGTPDIEFQLRSERSGLGVGRKYTIIYTASDADGNTARDTVCVTVPHDRSGGALASVGMGPDGGFVEGADEFVLIVPSIPVTAADDPLAIEHNGVGGTGRGDDGQLIFDARQVDPDRAMVGNLRGVSESVRAALGDADEDGYLDRVFFFPVADVNALIAASTLDDGAIGLHYETQGETYFVPDIFALGPPVPLPIDGLLVYDGSAVQSGGGAGTTGTPAPGPVKREEGPTPLPPTPATPATLAQTQAPLTQAPASHEPVVAKPDFTALAGVYPNPFEDGAAVAFSLARDSKVELTVYALSGARVRTLQSGSLPAGNYRLPWDGRDDAGRALPRGIYLVRLVAGNYHRAIKAAMMR